MMNECESRKATTVVAVISSNYLLRLGLQRIVENEKWIHLIGHVSNHATLDDMLAREQPHVMIVDTDISKDISGLVKRMKSVIPRIRIILLSGLEDPESTRQAIDFAVDGIVLKVQPSAVLVATIRYLTRSASTTGGPMIQNVGKRVAVNEVSRSPISHVQPSNASQTKWPDGLTERERDVIKLISLGLSNKDIADRLCISSITVRHHLTNIFDKLGVSNRQKLLIRAHQFGIEELSALA